MSESIRRRLETHSRARARLEEQAADDFRSCSDRKWNFEIAREREDFSNLTTGKRTGIEEREGGVRTSTLRGRRHWRKSYFRADRGSRTAPRKAHRLWLR